jgi:F0F1-type ATP synthase membrane subunit c/vacuolar-type H+-ATPase subunit K
VATAVGGAIVGAAAAAGYVASKKLSGAPEEDRLESHTEV